jgi:hypothetical protein
MPRNTGVGRRDFFSSGASATVGLAAPTIGALQDTGESTVCHPVDAYLRSFAAVDSHDHLRPFGTLWGYVQTDRDRGMNLYGLWSTSYFPWSNHLTTWSPGETFDAWWRRAKHDFDNAHATTFYWYRLPAFHDLYGVNFDRGPRSRAVLRSRSKL